MTQSYWLLKSEPGVYSIDDLAPNATFEEVVYLLYYKKLPNALELKSFNAEFAAQRVCNEKILEEISVIPKSAHPMVVLRTIVSALSFYDSDVDNMSFESNQQRAVRTTAQLGTIIAAYERVRNNKKPIAPQKNLSYAANFLYMLNGVEPDALFVRALDQYLVLLADHELNASTFACRVTASTLSDYYSAITSALGALKGPLHGGANEQVIRMLLEIGELSKVELYIKNAILEKKKIMGFGHRVYKVKDPRSPILKVMAEQVCAQTNHSELFAMSVKIDEMVTNAKKLPSNVDFYSATLLYCIGVPTPLFTPLFAASRIAGWSAHYLEQVSDNRLIRPRAEYMGEMNLPFVALNNR